ncbi:MAG: hypothetical protein HC905_05750 [Bacteroidales bacterium]|nr:hypothetical protein [Bacteroidales bacterium]
MRFILFFLMLTVSVSASGQVFTPVNKNASPEAKKLLSYLYTLKGKHTIAGQHNYNHSLNQYMDTVKSITGFYPGIWGADFIMNGTKSTGEEIVSEAIKKV